MRRKCADCDRSTAVLLGCRAAKVAPIHVSAGHPKIALISPPATALKAHLSAVFSAGSGRAVCLANFPRLALVIVAATLIRRYFDPIDFRRDVRTATPPPPQSPLRLTRAQYGHSSYGPITGRLSTPVPARPLPLRAPMRSAIIAHKKSLWLSSQCVHCFPGDPSVGRDRTRRTRMVGQRARARYISLPFANKFIR